MFTKGAKIFFSILLMFLFISQSSELIRAHESITIKNETINPGSFYYSFKRAWEKVSEKLQFGEQSKINFYESLLKTRLAELNFVVEKKLLSEVQTASERFSYQAGILSSEIVKTNKDKEKTIKEFKQMQIFLDKLRDKYPANSSFWMLVQHDINTLTILSDKLK